MNKRGSPENLIPITSETARELQRRGAKKRKENNEKRKKMQETLDILLRKSIKKGDKIRPEDIASIAEANNLNVDAQTAILLATVQRAMMGDIQSTQFIRDTIGEKPKDKVEIDESLTIESWAKNHKVTL